ncbi:hypothetical protein CEXT_172151 [Caerostris extrusa]|uniref:Uncharacterized protein n=1 Tax=Caerostris extrusa TaxID=172846 RepID=A0AAV4XXF9_CAEEX|nr:hypothetical protein CEXT_172151 [Caerostris extrusa]
MPTLGNDKSESLSIIKKKPPLIYYRMNQVDQTVFIHILIYYNKEKNELNIKKKYKYCKYKIKRQGKKSKSSKQYPSKTRDKNDSVCLCFQHGCIFIRHFDRHEAEKLISSGPKTISAIALVDKLSAVTDG